MPQLLEGKTALILGVANKWSLAYAIAQAFRREGAAVLLTYQNERLKSAVEDLGSELGAARVFECDVTKDEDLAKLPAQIGDGKLDVVVHSVAFANREDLSRPFVETSRAGFLLAQDVSAYSLVGVARAAAPLMTNWRFDHDLDLSRFHASGAELQRDGRGEGGSGGGGSLSR